MEFRCPYFRTSTGRSPHRCLIERRIRRAKELLLGAEQSIAEIAASVGFASHSQFTDTLSEADGHNALPLSNGPELNCMTVTLAIARAHPK
jgi:AraC-like DNA-binding protein